MAASSVDAALRRMDLAAGRPPRPVEAPAPRDAAPPVLLDASLRWRFLAALDADLALHPQALAAAEPIRWATIGGNWWAT